MKKIKDDIYKDLHLLSTKYIVVTSGVYDWQITLIGKRIEVYNALFWYGSI